MRSIYIISDKEFDFNKLSKLKDWILITDEKIIRELTTVSKYFVFILENKKKNVRIFFSKSYGCYHSGPVLPINLGSNDIYSESFDFYDKPLNINDDIVYKLCNDINKLIEDINEKNTGSLEAVCTIRP
ncbi:hypothetical protein HMPREF9630_00569 [Peptoanaerobacter stomatis]|uniref:Uncharacterized protein n=1 Tax=Peptoanaerobacter stomatis TaxID=796937 RepID=V9HVC0_9FIRM|nr:hypothetical protein [Peptoanaerobacter stomatis]EHL17402.1 hypothetical protein HMPREF9630_00569 [Peptoanaerobacter stomatis]